MMLEASSCKSNNNHYRLDALFLLAFFYLLYKGFGWQYYNVIVQDIIIQSTFLEVTLTWSIKTAPFSVRNLKVRI